MFWFLWSPSFCWLWEVVVLFNRCFRCRVRLSIQCISCFLRYDSIAINFPLRNAFAESLRFCVVVFSLSFVYRNLLISFLISSVTSLLFSNVLFNLHECVFCHFSLCSWYPVSISCGQRRYLIQFQFFKVYWGLICGPRCGLSWRMFCVHLRRKCILLHLDGKSWRYQLGPFGVMFHLRYLFPYLFPVLMICPLVKVGC